MLLRIWLRNNLDAVFSSDEGILVQQSDVQVGREKTPLESLLKKLYSRWHWSRLEGHLDMLGHFWWGLSVPGLPSGRFMAGYDLAMAGRIGLFLCEFCGRPSMTSRVLAEGVPDFRCLQWMIYNLWHVSTPQPTRVSGLKCWPAANKNHHCKSSCSPNWIKYHSGIPTVHDFPNWIIFWLKKTHGKITKKISRNPPCKRRTYRTWSLAFSKCWGLGQIERLSSVVPDAHRNFKWYPLVN